MSYINSYDHNTCINSPYESVARLDTNNITNRFNVKLGGDSWHHILSKCTCTTQNMCEVRCALHARDKRSECFRHATFKSRTFSYKNFRNSIGFAQLFSCLQNTVYCNKKLLNRNRYKLLYRFHNTRITEILPSRFLST